MAGRIGVVGYSYRAAYRGAHLRRCLLFSALLFALGAFLLAKRGDPFLLFAAAEGLMAVLRLFGRKDGRAGGTERLIAGYRKKARLWRRDF